MPYELSDIKQIRKKLGLTQGDLAKRANVSQSLIAKIESNKIDPTYSKTVKIFNTLDDLQKKQEIKASEIMTKKVIDVRPDDNIKDAINKMKKFGISQMPVIDEHNSVGLVSESIILDALIDHKGKSVRDIMQESPPIVSKETSIQVISSLLRHFPMVLVSENGKLTGLITKADLLGKLYGG